MLGGPLSVGLALKPHERENKMQTMAETSKQVTKPATGVGEQVKIETVSEAYYFVR